MRTWKRAFVAIITLISFIGTEDGASGKPKTKESGKNKLINFGSDAFAKPGVYIRPGAPYPLAFLVSKITPTVKLTDKSGCSVGALAGEMLVTDPLSMSVSRLELEQLPLAAQKFLMYDEPFRKCLLPNGWINLVSKKYSATKAWEDVDFVYKGDCWCTRPTPQTYNCSKTAWIPIRHKNKSKPQMRKIMDGGYSEQLTTCKGPPLSI